jgi:hypothetical protein
VGVLQRYVAGREAMLRAEFAGDTNLSPSRAVQTEVRLNAPKLVMIPLLALAAAAIATAFIRGGREQFTADTTPAGFDLSTGGGRPAVAGFSPHELVAGAPPDQIPAILRPRFDSAAAANHLLGGMDPVLGVDVHGDARAYPTQLLALHEVVDDTVGGRPIAVTWCPLCASGLVFDRRVAGHTLTFAVSGYLLHSNQVLYDRETRSLWSQVGAGGLTGAMRGVRLRLVPAREETWRAWRAEHPDTRVLSIRHDRFASRFLHPSTYVDNRGEESSDDPYLAYQQKISIYHGSPIDGISGDVRVVGIQVRGGAKAYPQPLHSRQHVLDDRLAGVALVVLWSDRGNAPAVFSRRVAGQTLRLRWRGGAIRDTATGSRWSAATGRAVAGSLRGTSLRPVPFTFPYWFAWRAIHPDTLIAGRSG